MIRRKLYFYNVLQKEKTQDTYFFAKLWMIILLFFQAKKIRKKYCVEKKMIITQFLMLFFLRGQKLDSLVWYDLGGPTNYVKIRISVVIVMLFVF